MILLDGSFGTCLWNKANKRGIENTPVWMYNKTHPDMVVELCKEYFDAGTSIIQTNTFSANKETLDRFSWDLKEVITLATDIAKKAREGYEGKKISLDVGPLPRYLDPIGDMTEKEAEEGFSQIIDAGLIAGVDQIFLETFTDLNLMKIAAKCALESKLPVFCSFSFDKRGRTLCGDFPEDIAKHLAEMGVNAVGINCSFGPKAAVDVLKAYKKALSGSDMKLIFKPNVDEGMTPDAFADECLLAADIADYMGACCGSSPEYIKALAIK